jgi:hypothetical protein
MDEHHFPSIIRLSVGGTKYQTSLATLLSEPNSMISAMFSGRHQIDKDDKGYYFIDRDGGLFNYILNYLRNKEIMLPGDEYLINALFKEAEYF